jgi:hypothetical protein
MERVNQKVPYFPRRRKPFKLTKEFILLLTEKPPLKSLIMFKKYTTHKNQDEKDVMLDWIQKITDLVWRENEPGAGDN